MFFDYKPPKEEPRTDWEGNPIKDPLNPLALTLTDKEKTEEEWKRIERKIYSKSWRAVHNLIAHPMLTIYRPFGEWLHDFTAGKMYEPNGKDPIVTDND